MGWNYYYIWVIVSGAFAGLSELDPDLPQVLPAELSAAAVLIDYWNKEINNAVWITMCLVIVIFINALGAGAYGEAEFIFASIKVCTTFILINSKLIVPLSGSHHCKP
jgi:yeast amino acid transporter